MKGEIFNTQNRTAQAEHASRGYAYYEQQEATGSLDYLASAKTNPEHYGITHVVAMPSPPKHGSAGEFFKCARNESRYE